MMDTFTMVVLGSLTALFGSVYAGILWLRKEIEHSFIRFFRYGYPLFTVSVLVGVSFLFALVSQFEPVVILDMSIDLASVRLLGSIFTIIGLIGCLGLVMLIGIGIELKPQSETDE